MRIAACIICAVAAEEMSAGRGVGVRRRVTEIAVVTLLACRSQKLRTDGDFVRVMCIVAHWSARTGTWIVCQHTRALTKWRGALRSRP